MLQRLRDAQTVSMRENGAVACSLRHACDAKQRLDDEKEKSMMAIEHVDELTCIEGDVWVSFLWGANPRSCAKRSATEQRPRKQ